MIKNYLKIAWRNLVKNKTFSVINILGLSIGISVCMMIFLFIMHEESFDRFHARGARTYRIMRHFQRESRDESAAYLSGLYAPALLNDYKGQITQAIRVNPNDDLVTIGTSSFHEKKVLDVDPGFLNLFSFPLLRGDAATALKDNSSVVLSETAAKKYFGSIDNAMGKTIEMDKSLVLKVTAIAKDVPTNSHIDFNMLVPLDNYKGRSIMQKWINNGLYTYIELAPSASAATLEQEFPAFMDKYMGAEMKKYGFHFRLTLTPLQDIYFEKAAFDSVKHGEKATVYIFLSIAGLILLIGCINFINLSTVRAVERSKEVGLRKVLGALRRQIIKQFIGESILVALISCALAIVLLFVAMPLYNQVLGYTLRVSDHPGLLLLFCAGVILLVGVMAGSYPAFFLSNFTPFEALKGKLRLGKGGANFRQGLVIIQFSISVFLIIGTIIMTKQMSFLKNQQLGYDKEQTLILPIDNNDIYNHLRSFKSDLENKTSIANVSVMSGEPGGFHDSHMFEVEGQADKWQARTEFADFEFVPTLGLKIIAGRNFSSRYGADTTNSVLINRTAATKLGWSPEQAIGKWIQNTVRDQNKRYIVGVVEDYNFLSLKDNIEPLVISPSEDWRTVLIKIKPGQLDAGMKAIQSEYAIAAPAYPLEYTFLDQQFGELYRNNLNQQTILTTFACLAIFVACLGLFGLASFTTARRVKEIGVRKVLGSSVQSIVVLLSKDLLKPVVLATCIAIPAGYYAMNTWLQNFAYRTSISIWVFLLAALVTFFIALLTVSVKAVNAARANPSKSLKSE